MFRYFVHRFIAFFLLLAALPILALFYVLMKCGNRQGESFIYRGERLGLNGRLFTIYKIRTLPENATQTLAEEIFRPGFDVELTYGRFLRASRLDELPQLWNIVKGEMALVGPRPVRPAIYERTVRQIPSYKRRLAVKPGLTGYAQLLTAHRAPKRIRSVIDNHYAEHKSTLFWDGVMLLRTGYAALMHLASSFVTAIEWRCRKLCSTGSLRERRAMKRVAAKRTEGCVTDEAFCPELCVWQPLDDINYSMLALWLDTEFDQDECINLLLRVKPSNRRGRRMARCYCLVFRRTEQTDRDGRDGDCTRFRHVLLYTPFSDYSRYVIDQYILHDRIG